MPLSVTSTSPLVTVVPQIWTTSDESSISTSLAIVALKMKTWAVSSTSTLRPTVEPVSMKTVSASSAWTRPAMSVPVAWKKAPRFTLTLPDTVESLSVQDPSRGTVTLSKLPPVISSLQLKVVAEAGAAIAIDAARPMPRTIASLRILLPLPAFSAKSARMLTARTCHGDTYAHSRVVIHTSGYVRALASWSKLALSDWRLAMHASIRRYQSSDVAEVGRRAGEEFVPIVRDMPGISAWYLVDGGDGTLITITLCDDAAAADASVERAGQWVRENIPDLVQGAPEVTNGEVRAQT